jgi:hypothetical protein
MALGKSGLCQELVMNGGAEETFIRNRVSIMSLDLLYRVGCNVRWSLEALIQRGDSLRCDHRGD